MMFPSKGSTKRFALVSCLLLSVLALLGCQSLPFSQGANPADGESLHEIIARGSLRVGVSGTQPPLNMKNANGELIGLDVELASALASAMDVDLELVEIPFRELLNSLEAGDIDLVISSLTITPARNARVAFAGPYLISGSSLLTRADLASELDSVTALNSADRSWAALENSTGQRLILDAFPLARFVPILDQEEAVERVAAGEIDGLVADQPFVEYALVRNPSLDLETLASPFTTEPLGIALPPNSPLFANLVQNYLNTLDYTGQLMQMKARWMSAGDWLGDMP